MTKKKVQNLLKHLVCILLCLTVILPFYMVLGAIAAHKAP